MRSFQRSVPFLAALLLTTMLVSCAKEPQDLVENVISGGDDCGQPGARIEATVDGSSFCANAQILAVGDGAGLMLTGVGLLGSSLVLQVDTLGLGAHAVTEAQNSMLLLQTGTSYVSTGEEAGTISITLADTVERRFTASFEATLRNEANGATRHVIGTADVTWSTGQ